MLNEVCQQNEYSNIIATKKLEAMILKVCIQIYFSSCRLCTHLLMEVKCILLFLKCYFCWNHVPESLFSSLQEVTVQLKHYSLFVF